MIDLIKQGMDRNAELVANVTPEQLGLPTPCSGFDVKELLNHIVTGNHMLALVGDGKEASYGDEPDMVGNDPLGAYKQSAEAAFAAWSDPAKMNQTFTFPFGQMPGPAAFGTVLLETWVHGWDLAKATGQDPTIPTPIAEALLAGLQAGGFDAYRNPEGNPFGLAVSVPDDASPTDKLVAFVGRTP